jgi:hypothetical protein
MILFLDFDGVLHGDPCNDKALLFGRLPPLEAVLRDAPLVKIVISSTWRDRRSLRELQEFFSPDIAGRIVGVTPRSRDFPDLAEVIGPTYQRSIEIEAWLRASPQWWSNWLALDDKRHWFRPFSKNLLCCDPRIGLSDENIAELRRRLL